MGVSLTKVAADIEAHFRAVGDDITNRNAKDFKLVAFRDGYVAVEGGVTSELSLCDVFPDRHEKTLRWRQRPKMTDDGQVYYRLAVV